MKPNYRLKNDWGSLKAGSVFKWKKNGYVHEFDVGGWIGLPDWFVAQGEDLFEMENPLKEPTLIDAVCIFLESTRVIGIGVSTVGEVDMVCKLFTDLRSAYEREKEKINGQNNGQNK